ncbi:unnamed protein product, partial [Rotaria magnacalcarata]
STPLPQISDIEHIFDSHDPNLELDDTEGKTFLKVLLNLVMYDYQPLARDGISITINDPGVNVDQEDKKDDKLYMKKFATLNFTEVKWDIAGPMINEESAFRYTSIFQILCRMMKLCVVEGSDGTLLHVKMNNIY